MVDPADEWQQALAQSVGRRVKHFRTLRKLTAQQLSDDLRTRFGIDMKRTVLGNLESGYRRVVNYAEILALAHVLNVPPLLLMVPIGEQEFSPIPGWHDAPWFSAAWITGEGVPPGPPPDIQAHPGWWDEYEAQMNFLGLYREHHALIGRWARALQVAESVENVDPASAGRTQQEIENALTLVRWAIRDRGGVPPRLPTELRGIDERDRPGR